MQVPKEPSKTIKHLENLKREITVLSRLQGSLNIVKLEVRACEAHAGLCLRVREAHSGLCVHVNHKPSVCACV